MRLHCRLLAGIPAIVAIRAALPLLSLAAALAFLGSGAPAHAQEPLDPYIQVEPDTPYGTRSVRVPAGAYWVNTGLFLRPGQSATLSATGTWRADASTGTYGPGGYVWRTNTQNGCRLGQLVARLGMEWNGRVWCIGTGGTITAPSAAPGQPAGGILYLAANTLTGDGGDWMDGRYNASGAVTATVASSGDTVPTILTADASAYDYSRVRSGWVELRTERIILAVPASLVAQDQANWLGFMLLLFDATHDLHTELRGAAPYRGQRIRFAVTETLPFPGAVMVAGNPIRMLPLYTSPTNSRRVTQFGDSWGFAHELGHDFTVVRGRWSYMTTETMESWPNIFTMHFHEQMGLPIREDVGCKPAVRDAYVASTSSQYTQFRGDTWLQLCFFMELKDTYGWDGWKQFFSILNAWTSTWPAQRVCSDGTCNSDAEYRYSDQLVWRWVRDRFNAGLQQVSPGANATPIFQRYKLPL